MVYFRLQTFCVCTPIGELGLPTHARLMEGAAEMHCMSLGLLQNAILFWRMKAPYLVVSQWLTLPPPPPLSSSSHLPTSLPRHNFLPFAHPLRRLLVSTFPHTPELCFGRLTPFWPALVPKAQCATQAEVAKHWTLHHNLVKVRCHGWVPPHWKPPAHMVITSGRTAPMSALWTRVRVSVGANSLHSKDFRQVSMTNVIHLRERVPQRTAS
jgi:hypothetical protein